MQTKCSSLLGLFAALLVHDAAGDAEFDCMAKEYAYEFAQQLQGWRGAVAMKEVFDSLELASECGMTFNSSTFTYAKKVPAFEVTANIVHHVCPVRGSDDVNTRGRGSEKLPFETIQAAVDSIRRLRAHGTGKEKEPATVVLREGKHRLRETLNLTVKDSFLTIQNYAGEVPTISGTVPLRTSWVPETNLPGNAYSTQLSDDAPRILALRVNHTQRGFKATFPNRNPELSLFPDGWVTNDTNGRWYWNAPKPPKTKQVFVHNDSPLIEEKVTYKDYASGVNGTCEIFTPPVSFFCSKSPADGHGAPLFMVPGGIQVNDSVGLKKYQNTEKAVFQVWRPGHWNSLMFNVESYDMATNNFSYGIGGFQGAQGSATGAEWYIEDVFEELDSSQEYYYNETERKLYYVYNATNGTPPPADLPFDAVVLETLISLVGTQKDPVQQVVLQGITIADAGPTYMSPHGVPSGGDWALQRLGAVFMEGTSDCAIRESLLTKLDGNGVMVSGYTRGLVIENNELSWIGDSPMASWGYTRPLNSTGNYSDSVLAQYKNGIDGTDGNQPMGTQVTGNYAREFGHFQKQSSFWFQAITAETNITGNIAFNMPRAAINLNDGYGGGTTLAWNLIWNTCRESGDHGPVNSWDRMPFLSNTLNGTAQLYPKYNEVYNNFIIANYGADTSVDNDDSSSWYQSHHNFFVYGGHKSNWDGINKHSYENLCANAKVYQDGLCIQMWQFVVPGISDTYRNNKCIQDAPNVPAFRFDNCNPDDLPGSNNSVFVSENNTIYNPNAGSNVTVRCGGKELSLAEWQAAGYDIGTKVLPSPSNAQIIAWAKELLTM